MDGWWNEEENFYPFEEAQEEDDLIPEEESQNPFTRISVADRFDQYEQHPHPTPKSFAPPKPGQLYGQAFSRMPPLTPARSFSDIQQGDLYGYAAPDDQPTSPAAPIVPPVSYPPVTNPFGAGVGASPLGAATPDTLPTVTGRTAPVRRSEQPRSQADTPVPIWSIDDDPVSIQSGFAGNTTSPYPGFPPLPQSSPDSWQQPATGAFPPVTAVQPPQVELDWTLPEYPAADPDWKPAEGESPEIPEFLKPQEEPRNAEETASGKSSMDKLNIPAYLRVRPLPKKAPRSAGVSDQEPDATEEQPAVAPARASGDSESQPGLSSGHFSDGSGHSGAAEEPSETDAWYTDAIFMRPGAAKTDVKQEPEESSPQETADTADGSAVSSHPDEQPPAECLPSDDQAPAAPSSDAEEALPTPAENAPEEAHTAEQAQPVQADDVPMVLSPSPRRRRRAAAVQEEAAPAAEMQQRFDAVAAPKADDSAASSPYAAAPVRKRRSQRNTPDQPAVSGDAPQENDRPFVLTVGAEEAANDPSAVRPAQSEPSPVMQPESPFFLPVNDEDEPPAPVYAFAGAGVPMTNPVEIDSEDDWKPYSPAPSPTAPLFPEETAAIQPSGSIPYGSSFPTLSGAEDTEWSLFGTSGGAGTEIPAVTAGTVFFPMEDDLSPGAAEVPESDSPLFPEDHPFSGSISNMTDNPLFGTSSYDAGDMPNPDRGNLPYELVSEFDTGSRSAAPAVAEPTASHTEEAVPSGTDSLTGMFPPIRQDAAQPMLTKPNLPPKPVKPPVNPVRVLLLVLAVGMAVFCIIAGGKMLLGYVQNTEEWSQTHQTFLTQNGVSMNQAGEMVQLPKDGSTFAPTGTPPTAATPSPDLSAFQHDTPPDNAETSAPTATPVRRTKIMQYPGNELRNILPDIEKIRKEYPDVIGKLVIPGVLEEWIVYRNNTYYLNHNYRGTSAEGGAVFMDAACTLETPPENLHLRGSGSVPGKTFHALWQYKTGGSSFLYNAEVAHVTTLYEEQAYLLLAVIETSGDPTQVDYFNYTSYPTFATDEEMMNFVALARQHSLYSLPTDIQPGDRLLTLSTVTGSGSDQSTNLVLIFRSMR